ncbi:MAG: hypothetical protein NTV93_20375, partial [Verrucomicrobia bacterium]|nr:hypothetical protein [Verrucomicrobiota bacterium]
PKKMKIFSLPGISLARPPCLRHHAGQVKRPEQLPSSFAADPATAITASLKNPSTVTRSDAKTGSYQGSISVSNAIAVGCDGTTIAVLSANGNVTRYDARTGSYQGSISAGAKATSVQVTGGVIIVQKDRTLTRYDAKTGSYLGSSSL